MSGAMRDPLDRPFCIDNPASDPRLPRGWRIRFDVRIAMRFYTCTVPPRATTEQVAAELRRVVGVSEAAVYAMSGDRIGIDPAACEWETR